MQFVEPFLTHGKIRASYAIFTYGVDGCGGLAYLLIPVNDGVLYLQTKVAYAEQGTPFVLMSSQLS